MHAVDAALQRVGRRPVDDPQGPRARRERRLAALDALDPADIFVGGIAFRFARGILDGEIVAMRAAPAKGDLQRLVQVVKGCGGRAVEGAGDGRVDDVIGAEADLQEVVGTLAGGFVGGPVFCLAGLAYFGQGGD